MAHTAIGHFMNQKDFHPANFHNQKRVWIAEQKIKADAAREKERLAEYQAEAAVHTTKGYALMGKAESDLAVKRHAVNFMYDAPPGMEKKDAEDKLELDPDRQLRLDEKFKALKGAPREEYAKDLPARDNPFGVQIRNVQCRKCDAWGHQSTDRECPLFGVARVGDDGEAVRHEYEDPAVLMRQMADDGLAIKQSALGRRNDAAAANQQILVEPTEDREAEFLASLSSSQKRKLHKRLTKLEDDPEAAAAAIADFAADVASGPRKPKKSKSKSKKDKKDKKDKKKKKKKHKSRDDDSGSSRRRRERSESESSDDSDDYRAPWDRHRDRSPVPEHDDRRTHRDDRGDGREQYRGGYGKDDGAAGAAPAAAAAAAIAPPSAGGPGRMTLQLSDAAYRLTGRAKPRPPPPTVEQLEAAERNAPLKCYRCGREGHTRSRCKELYHKSGSRLMKGHFH